VRRVVFDANIWVSAFAFPGPVPRAVIDLARMRQVRAVVSQPIVDQVTRRLTKFGWSPERIVEAERDIEQISLLATPESTLDVVSAKPSDNRILECAFACRADFIVTGDAKHLLRLGHYEGIPIVSPREFLRLFTRDFS
jgi:putative PIN family toxin of toxin-antitoxin system